MHVCEPQHFLLSKDVRAPNIAITYASEVGALIEVYWVDSQGVETVRRESLLYAGAMNGKAQAHRYADTISAALDDLTAGPVVAGAKKRDDIQPGIFALHVARNSRKGRHFVIFRVGQTSEGDVIEVLRLLHDAMDLERHLP
jgi:toxin ParE1/3/4